MSYDNNGIEFDGEGLGAVMATNAVDAGLRALQQDLQRMGLLAAGTGSSGADGRWGPITSNALVQAARRIGWAAAAPFTQRSSTSIEVPDELVARIHAAAATPTAPGPTVTATPTDLVPAPTTTSSSDMPVIPSGPGILPGSNADTSVASSTTNWPLIIGGVAGLTFIGLIAYGMMSSAPTKNRVRRNRVRRNRTKRSRRYRAR